MNLDAIRPLKGWCTPEKAIALAGLVRHTRPSVCVEIGVFGGQSLVATALALRENGAGVVYGIDPWEADAATEGTDPATRDWWGREDLVDAYRGCCEAVTRLQLWPWVRLLCGRAESVAGAFRRIDCLHIDGNHSPLASCRDVCLYLPLVRPGGWVWLDDANWVSVQPAAAVVASDCELAEDHGSFRLYRRRA